MAFGEASLGEALSGFIEFDLDRERELFLDAAGELFLDPDREELRDLEPDFAERCECGDCELFLTFFSAGSREWDLDRDLDILLL